MNVEDLPDGTLIADGFDEALVGFWQPMWDSTSPTIAVYSTEDCITCLVKQGMSEEDAWDYFQFNVEGAYMGPGTPIFIQTEA